METALEKNIINNIETDEEINLLLERQKEAKEGKVKLLDDSVKEFIEKRQAWKNLV